MRLTAAVAAIMLSVCSCAFVTESPRLVPGRQVDKSFFVKVPAKVHLLDGSVVVCGPGLTLSPSALVGSGMRYDLLRRDSAPVVPRSRRA